MASPRTFWTGSISIGLVNLPVTIGKAWDDKRDTGMKDLCEKHHTPVNRDERCPHCGVAPSKVKGTLLPDGSWHVFTQAEIDAISAATNKDLLQVEDVQPLIALPMEYQIGFYFVRHNTKAKGAQAKNFGTFVEALESSGLGIVVKWVPRSSQKLCVLHAKGGVLRLSVIPMYEDINWPGDAETAHHGSPTNPAEVAFMAQLLNSMGRPTFDHTAYEDTGLKLMHEAVEQAIQGAPAPQATTPVAAPAANDLMSLLQASFTKTDVPHGGVEETTEREVA